MATPEIHTYRHPLSRPAALPILVFCSGFIAGLVAVTPAAGNSGPFGAIVLGAVASVICFYAVTVLKPKLGYDDALDAFGIHGIGGIVGAIGTGLVYAPSLGGPGGDDFAIGPTVAPQIAPVLVAIGWSTVGPRPEERRVGTG